MKNMPKRSKWQMAGIVVNSSIFAFTGLLPRWKGKGHTLFVAAFKIYAKMVLDNQDINFPVGYEKFHKKQLFNFQMNRPYSFGYARFEDLKEVGPRIDSFKAWKREMLKLAEKAVSEGRLMNAAFYYRAAEFCTKSNEPDKEILYDKFIGLFYKAFEGAAVDFKL